MNKLEFAKKIMHDIKAQTNLIANLNEINQIEVEITNTDRYAIDIDKTWKKYKAFNDTAIIENFSMKQVNNIKMMVAELKDTEPEANQEKLILKLTSSRTLDLSTALAKHIAGDLVLAVAIETEKYTKIVQKNDLKKMTAEDVWEIAAQNSSRKGNKEYLTKHGNLVYDIYFFDNTAENISKQFVDKEYIEKNFRNHFFAMPEESEILVFKVNISDRKKQMMALNYLKEKVVKRFNEAAIGYSDKIYYYNDENELKEL